MKRSALVPALLAAASLAGCGSNGAPSTAQTGPGARVGPMSIGVTGGQLGGAITDTSGGREQELSKARDIDPRVLRQAPNLNEGVAGATACANADLQPDTTNLPTISDATFCLLNAERASRGLTALKPDRRLQRAALAHGGDMVDHQYFAHEARDGSQPAERIRATGYLSGGGAWRIGENLAWGTGDVTEFGVVEGSARVASRQNGARAAAKKRARKRSAARRQKARMRARRARIALVVHHHRHRRTVGRVARVSAGLR
jgi:hypothetical protein